MTYHHKSVIFVLSQIRNERKEVITVNPNLLKGKMAEKGVNQTELARAIGISTNSMSRKLSGKREFQLSEAVAISKFLELTNPSEIFFD